MCRFRRGDLRIGAIYQLPSGEDVCVHVRPRESSDHSMAKYYEEDREGVTKAGLATMAMKGANTARIDPNIIVRFEPLSGISRTRMNLESFLKPIVYNNTYDETIEGGFLAYKTNFDELQHKQYTSVRGGYCTIEEAANGSRMKLCYRIDAECDQPFRPMKARSVNYVFQFASWYKTTYGKDLVLKLSYGDKDDPTYKNGQIVEDRAAFLVFNKTTVQEDYVIYDHAYSMMVYGLPDWALIDLAQPLSSTWSPGDPVLPANPQHLPTVSRICFRVYKVPKPVPEPNTTTTTTEKPVPEPNTTTTTTTEKPVPEPTTSTTTTEKPVPEPNTTTTTSTTTTEKPIPEPTTTEEPIPEPTTTTTEESKEAMTKIPTNELVALFNRSMETGIDDDAPRTKFNNRVESKYNQIRRDGMNVNYKTDGVDPSSLIPGIENRMLYFLIGFMGVMIVALCVGMIVHYEFNHR